jgi:hypothetical protein
MDLQFCAETEASFFNMGNVLNVQCLSIMWLLDLGKPRYGFPEEVIAGLAPGK